MNATLRKIINAHNLLSDKNLIWFPFLFLKPKPDTIITQSRILIMTLCFGGYAALALVIRAYLSGTVSTSLILKNIAYTNLAFFTWFQIVTSTLWNIRARELTEEKK